MVLCGFYTVLYGLRGWTDRKGLKPV